VNHQLQTKMIMIIPRNSCLNHVKKFNALLSRWFWKILLICDLFRNI